MSFSSDVKSELEKKMKPDPLSLKSYLQKMFIRYGSISDPQKSYHLEFVCKKDGEAEQLMHVLASYDIVAGRTSRKNHDVVYIKGGEAIIEFLNIVGAHKALLDMEEQRVLKECANRINRQVNCEAANVAKVTDAGQKQIRAIETIQEKKGLSYLPENLREIALLRLENPDVSLIKLGEMLDPPVGKSGVNHRLRKIIEIAEEL
ncbi:MAG: DNA-binding protein WhiA [Lachnospiraceae bacterium]|nr:DNA-binding protein WhiA [Lachnospiraceae bacterium]